MYFPKQLPEDQHDGYADVLAKLSNYLGDLVLFLLDADEVGRVNSYPEQKYHHVSVQMLTHHFAEQIDGVAVLTRQGCAEACKGPLRSAFEGMMAILYMLEKDTERRGLAYQVGHVHNKIRLTKRCLDSDPESVRFQKLLPQDAITAINAEREKHEKQIRKWESMFLKPEFAPIEAEWQAQRAKHGNKLKWFTLFGGPSPNVEQLAKRLDMSDWYEVLYRQWCDTLHVGDALSGVLGRNGDEVHMRPIRHPANLQQWVMFAGLMAQKVARAVLLFYATTEQQNEFQSRFERDLQQRSREIAQGNCLKITWLESKSA